MKLELIIFFLILVYYIYIYYIESYGKGFYVILIGKVSVQIPAKNEIQRLTQGDFEEVARLDMGCCFGELASILGQRYCIYIYIYIYRSARVQAIEHSYFAMIPNKAFETILKKKNEKRVGNIIDFLLSTPYFKKCHPRNMYLVQYYFRERQFFKGQIVYNIGDLARHIYLVINGEFEVLNNSILYIIVKNYNISDRKEYQG